MDPASKYKYVRCQRYRPPILSPHAYASQLYTQLPSCPLPRYPKPPMTNLRGYCSSPLDASSTPNSSIRTPMKWYTALERPKYGSLDKASPPLSATRRPPTTILDQRPVLPLSLHPPPRVLSRRSLFKRTIPLNSPSSLLCLIALLESRMEGVRPRLLRSIGSSSMIRSLRTGSRPKTSMRSWKRPVADRYDCTSPPFTSSSIPMLIHK